VILIQQGVIGKIKALHAWTGARFPGRGRPEGEDAVPGTLAWDQWLGVAPARPFKQGVYHPFNWRGWQAFGTGPLGDFGCHILDTPFKALELTAPTALQATVPPDWAQNEEWNTEHWPDWGIIEYTFPGTKWTVGDIDVTWYDGGKQPARELVGFEDPSHNLPGGGSLFIGEGGTMVLPHIGPPQLYPDSKNKSVERPVLEGRSHYHSFVDACLGRGKTTAHFGFAGPLAGTVLLGNVANRRHGKQLKWDSAALKVTNDEVADKLLRRSYREIGA
jgi:predicted dehydrogenase